VAFLLRWLPQFPAIEHLATQIDLADLVLGLGAIARADLQIVDHHAGARFDPEYELDHVRNHSHGGGCSMRGRVRLHHGWGFRLER
jgi:hypothetical protein